MTHSRMYERIVASDPGCDGRFFTGVLTTGIYCLPSCRARKPKPQNVRFFPTCEAARAAGLRPCLKCHPDDFARGADPVIESTETLVAEIREAPEHFADVAEVVRRSGFGTTRAFELFRRHFHATPADILLRARLDRAKERLLAGDDPILRVADGVGFESVSVFHEHFRRLNGLTPTAYRRLRADRRFTLALPAGYPLPHLLRTLGRDPQSLSERMSGGGYEAAVRLDGTPALLSLEFSAAAVAVRIGADGARREPGAAAHELAVRLLGLDQDAAAFVRLAGRLGLGRLVAGRPGLRISRIPSVFDGLLWSIIGQQINFPFACTLRRRLVEHAGSRLPNGLVAPPTPEAVAGLEPDRLRAWQFSRQKTEYLLAASRLVAGGELDLEALRRMSATRAERTLLAVRGLGPWSVNYLLMRSLGFADCVPLGDTGVASGLQSLFRLGGRPDIDATRRLMAVFSPFRSLATAHLWQLNQPKP